MLSNFGNFSFACAWHFQSAAKAAKVFEIQIQIRRFFDLLDKEDGDTAEGSYWRVEFLRDSELGMSGKIAHLSNRQTSDFRKQLKKNSQSGPKRYETNGTGQRIVVQDIRGGMLVVVSVFGGSHVNSPNRPEIFCFSAVCARKLLLWGHWKFFETKKKNQKERIQNEWKKGKEINWDTPVWGRHAPCHAFLMKCQSFKEHIAARFDCYLRVKWPPVRKNAGTTIQTPLLSRIKADSFDSFSIAVTTTRWQEDVRVRRDSRSCCIWRSSCWPWSWYPHKPVSGLLCQRELCLAS